MTDPTEAELRWRIAKLDARLAGAKAAFKMIIKSRNPEYTDEDHARDWDFLMEQADRFGAMPGDEVKIFSMSVEIGN
jgi:hypothetical protein